MAGFIDLFRNGVWLTRERVRLVALAVLAASLIGAAFLTITAHGLNDRLGRPLGTDFSSFYAAGTLVLTAWRPRPMTTPRISRANRRSSAPPRSFTFSPIRRFFCCSQAHWRC